MNMHVMQSESTRSEAANICLVEKNMIAPKNSNPVIGLVQGGLLAAYLLSQRDKFISRTDLMDLLMCFKEREMPPIPKPAIMKPMKLWTGKQLIGMIIPDINMYPERFSFDKADSTLYIRNGKFLSGVLTKKHMGARTGSILHIVRNDKGDRAAGEFLDTMKFTLNEWLKLHGFSVGIGDAYMDDKEGKIEAQINDIINGIEPDVQQYIKTHKHLDPEQLESGINNKLNKVVGDVGQLVLKHLRKDNNFMQMVVSGSKGNENNIAQIIGLLGGQNVAGKRIGFGYHRRSLPHYDYNSKGAGAKGFVFNSYKKGLTPQEYFFHAMGGREGLVDTAIKTGEVGYISRKLMKAMEDLGVQYDKTVRNSMGDIVQIMYGEDDIDSCSLEVQKVESATLPYSKFLKEYAYSDQEIQSFIGAYEESKVLLDDALDQLHEDRKFLIHLHTVANGLYASMDLGFLYLPVNIDRVIKNAIQKFGTKKNRSVNVVHPVFALREIDRLETRLEDIRGPRLMKLQPQSLKNFMISVRSKLSPKQVTHKHFFSTQALQYVCDIIVDTFCRHLVQPGEMVGSIAAESLGEPTQQMTLNSVSYDTQIVIKSEYDCRKVKIGEWIDNIMKDNEIEMHAKGTEYVSLKESMDVPTVDKSGNVFWSSITAVTRHPPHGDLVKVTTRAGKKVIATKTKSLLIWNPDLKEFEQRRGSDIKLGDCLPSITTLKDDKVIKTLDVYKYLPKTEWIYRIDLPDKIPLDEETGFFLGMYLAEGWATDTFVGISNHEESLLDRIRNWCSKYSVTTHTVVSTNDRFPGSKSVDLKIHSVTLARLFKIWMGTGSANKRVPEEAFGSSSMFAKGILDGYFAGDGTVDKRDLYLVMSSSSEELIQDISLLCNRFGIFGKMSSHQPKSNNVGSKNINRCYTLSIRYYWVTKWKETVGCSHNPKSELLNTVNHSKFGNVFTPVKDVVLDPVVSIEILNESDYPKVYDLTVPSTTNFVLANGLGVVDTFHSAGMSKANVTLGVPRVKEVIHAVQNPKAPTMNVYFTPDISDSADKVLKMKMNIQGTLLKDVLVNDETSVVHENETFLPPFPTQFKEDQYWVRLFYTIMFNGATDPTIFSNYVIRLVFDSHKLQKRGLTLNSIANHLRQLLGDEMLILNSDVNYSKPVIRMRLIYDKPPVGDDDRVDECKFMKQYLRQHLKEFILSGAPNIENSFVESTTRKVYNPETNELEEKHEWYLLTEGSDLKKILNWKGVDYTRTICNNPTEILSVLGIEATRQSIINEISRVMNFYGIQVNYRNLSALADTMTNRGGIMAINRHGINRTDDSPLKKCTFEETVDMLLDAGKDCVYDALDAVSSNIIVGKLSKVGTGTCNLKWDNELGKKYSTPRSAISRYKKMEHQQRKERRKTSANSPERANKFGDEDVERSEQHSTAMTSSSNQKQFDNIFSQVDLKDVNTSDLFGGIADF